MATHKILAVRDIQMEEYHRPFTVPATGGGVRSFTDEINRASPDNPMHAHPSDYHLYEIGTFDTDTGEITRLSNIRLLARGEDVLIKQAPSSHGNSAANANT